MKVLDAPLVKPCQFTALNGNVQTGVHVATIGSKSGLAEYLIIYDPKEDRVLAFRKMYLNPDDLAEYNISGIANADLLQELADFCNAEGLFDHLPELKDDSSEGRPEEPS